MSKNKLDITPELAQIAARTIKEFCSYHNSNCTKDNIECPFLREDLACAFSKVRIPSELKV